MLMTDYALEAKLLDEQHLLKREWTKRAAEARWQAASNLVYDIFAKKVSDLERDEASETGPESDND